MLPSNQSNKKWFKIGGNKSQRCQYHIKNYLEQKTTVPESLPLKQSYIDRDPFFLKEEISSVIFLFKEPAIFYVNQRGRERNKIHGIKLICLVVITE